MAFPTPTTKQEMYDILDQIFKHYRVNNHTNILEDLKELDLERLTFSPLDSEQLLEKATTLLIFKHAKEESELKSEIFKKIKDEQIRLEATLKSIDAKIEGVNSAYSSQIKSLKKEAQKKNLEFSDLYLDRLSNIEKDRDLSINELNALKIYEQEKSASIIETLNSSLEEMLTKLKELQQVEISVKVKELVDEQAKLEREVYKYNNQLDEKEQRYKNTLQQNIATYRIKLIEAQGEEFTESELINMGYYADVVTCVYAYYDSLPPVQAYEEYLNDSQVMPYLEKFYDQVLAKYRARSVDS